MSVATLDAQAALDVRIRDAQQELTAARQVVESEFARCVLGSECEALAGARATAAQLSAALDELLQSRELMHHRKTA